MPLPYCTETKAERIAKQIASEYGGAKGDGKTWRELNLTQEDILQLVQGGKIVNKFTEEYNPTNFKNDYFLCKIDQTSDLDGAVLYEQGKFEKVYMNMDGITDILPYLSKSLTSGMINAGFDHNYYQTLVLYAGCDKPVGDADYILRGTGVLEGSNVIYMQDVTQQDWEGNYDVAVAVEGKEKEKEVKERLNATQFGGAFVISIKGTTNFAAAFVLGKSQLAYWDTTSNSVKWANTEPGKWYQVTFDTTHDTLRWLATTHVVEDAVWATEVTTEQKTAMLNTGITFAANKYAAIALEDTSAYKVFTKCIGLGDKYLSKILSFNTQFSSPESTHLEYIGRPVGYILDTYTWEEYDEEQEAWIKHVEKNGEHVWESNVQGVPIQLIIPDNIDEEGVAHRNRFILEFDFSAITTTETLYRHTFRIYPDSNATFQNDDWIVNCTFQAVNAQMGDSAIDYILFSDESKQWPYPDWTVPCQGKVGKVSIVGETTTITWYDAYRIKATYTADPNEDEGVRCLAFEYIDTNTQQPFEIIQSVAVVTANNYYKFVGTDFRSAIATYETPASINLK